MIRREEAVSVLVLKSDSRWLGKLVADTTEGGMKGSC